MPEKKFSYKIHFSVHERKILTGHFATRVKPKSRKQRRQFNNVFEELVLDDLEEELATKQILMPDDGDKDLVDVYELGKDTVDYMLDALNTEVPGLQARTVLGIEDRLIAAKESEYKLPEELKTKLVLTSADAKKALPPVNSDG